MPLFKRLFAIDSTIIRLKSCETVAGDSTSENAYLYEENNPVVPHHQHQTIPNTLDNVDSFLQSIVAKLDDLSKYGLLARKDGIEICRAKVYLVIASGDFPAVAILAGHTGHSSTSGCKLCTITTNKVNRINCFDTFGHLVRAIFDFCGSNVSKKEKICSAASPDPPQLQIQL